MPLEALRMHTAQHAYGRTLLRVRDEQDNQIRQVRHWVFHHGAVVELLYIHALHTVIVRRKYVALPLSHNMVCYNAEHSLPGLPFPCINAVHRPY